MKRYVFKIILVASDVARDPGVVTLEDHVAVEARGLNSAWVKAAQRAGRTCRAGEIVHDITWESAS